MYLLEKEAQQKWCPMGRIPAWNDEHGNALPVPVASTHDSLCRASAREVNGFCGLAGNPTI